MRCISFSIERSTSRIGRSKSLILLSESIPSEIVRFTTYERLSMRFEGGEPVAHETVFMLIFEPLLFEVWLGREKEVSVVKEKRERRESRHGGPILIGEGMFKVGERRGF
ncbi:hypothetical protein AMTR_s00166p00050240 [Amborella trichopoda]|uniref:Uncharacterized protein n=1 Tax=Amborella trichopoda TaxID=13333 RepID=W1PR37_AMBTC|nr:hypothetical protein AMTR_s00166p00050240 [Amborella trichopoda]